MAHSFWTLLPAYLFLHFSLAALASWAWLRSLLGDTFAPLVGAVVYTACGPTFSLTIFPSELPGHALLPMLLLGWHWLLSARVSLYYHTL